MALSGFEDLHTTIDIGDVAADSDAILTPLVKLQRNINITKILFGVDTTITLDNTDYQKVEILSGATVLASIITGTAGSGDQMTLGIFVEKTVSSANREVAAGTTLTANYIKTGAGMALSGLRIQLVHTVDA